MSIVSNIVKPIVRPIVSSIVKGIVTRYFTTLKSASSQHYAIPAWTASGDFVIEIEFTKTDTSSRILLGDNFLTAYYLNVDSTKFSLWAAGNRYDFAHGGVPHDGKLHKVKYVLVGTLFEIFLDGLSLGTAIIVPYTGANSFLIGSSNNNPAGYNYNGVIANVSISEAGGDNRFYSINENWVSNLNLIDSIGSQTGTAINITSVDASKYVFNGSVSPNTWTMADPPNTVIEVAGT